MAKDTLGTGDSSKRTTDSGEGLSTHADGRTIFQHVLACVLPEPALRPYVHLDEAANSWWWQGEYISCGITKEY